MDHGQFMQNALNTVGPVDQAKRSVLHFRFGTTPFKAGFPAVIEISQLLSLSARTLI